MDEMYREIVTNLEMIEENTQNLSESSIKLIARIERMTREIHSMGFQGREALKYSAEQLEIIRNKLENSKKELKHLVPFMRQIVKKQEYQKLEKKIKNWTPELYIV
jgi:hypothetical protein